MLAPLTHPAGFRFVMNYRRLHRFTLGLICLGAMLLLAVGLLGSSGQPTASLAAERAAAVASALPKLSDCASCHTTDGGYVGEKSHPLNGRAKLTKAQWGAQIPIVLKCGVCHLAPDPSTLSRGSWGEVIAHMTEMIGYRKMPQYTKEEWSDILHYYYVFSPERQRPLYPDPLYSPVAFERSTIGSEFTPDEHPKISNVNIVDLNQDGKLDILICDMDRGDIDWIHRIGNVWREDRLGSAAFPSHAEVIDYNGDGKLDIIVGFLGSPTPTDERLGGVILLTNTGTGKIGDSLTFSRELIKVDLGRVADVEPGDFDRDGDLDFIVANFGYVNEGGIGWLERKNPPDTGYAYHIISPKAGAIHVPTIDLNGDGKIDFMALISQEHEEISAFINKGDGTFEEKNIFRATTPAFGSSGIQLVDIDGDRDLDILYTNGDNADLPTTVPMPYQGVQWLENKGNLEYVYHSIIGFYGAYRAVAGDVDGDGDVDIVATSLFNDWEHSVRQSLIWLENDGKAHFTGHGIANAPTHLVTAALGDLDGDGRLDIVAGGMHFVPPFDRIGRVTLWHNLGSKPKK